MKDPVIKVVGDKGTILEQTLWIFITQLIYEGEIVFSGEGDIKVYLDGEEVQQPASMEDKCFPRYGCPYCGYTSDELPPNEGGRSGGMTFKCPKCGALSAGVIEE